MTMIVVVVIEVNNDNQNTKFNWKFSKQLLFIFSYIFIWMDTNFFSLYILYWNITYPLVLFRFKTKKAKRFTCLIMMN